MRRQIWIRGKRAGVVLALCGATAMTLHAQTFTVLYDFCSQNGCLDGRHPSPTLIQGVDGNLYGGAYSGGFHQGGTIFKLTPKGQVTTLYNFCSQWGCADGANPYGAFVLGMDGNIYGATSFGGTTNSGVLFKMTPGGQVTTVHTFCLQAGCPDGAYPCGSIVQDGEGNIYGTAAAGGTHGPNGTVFWLAPTGALTVLHSFCTLSGCADGRFPIGALTQQPGGTFYGATASGGTYGKGTVFAITKHGSLTTLYSFCSQSGCADGADPTWLLMGTDGNLYGTTSQGGTHSGGTVFKMSPTGQLVTIYNFCSQPSCADGSYPSSLIQATDGNFYGMTMHADGTSTGNIFQVTPSGSLTVLHTLCANGVCTDGRLPSTGGLFQHSNGTFYGVIGKGGNVTSNGTAFDLAEGLAPFVMTVPLSAKAGAAVQVLGSNLTAAAKVTFNGTAAAFTVVSSSEITANVPAGATTGPVQVVTPGGTLSSNTTFTVLH